MDHSTEGYVEQFPKRRGLRPQQIESRPHVKAASFSGAGHDRVMTSALHGGVFALLEIPAVLKTQLLSTN
jgi:hypothetical protein